ncbi:MAG: hypothetical protein SNJ75_05485 [Gemmataceae bacterium]
MLPLTRLWIHLLLGVAIATGGLVNAAAPPSLPDSLRVKQLLSDLGDRDFAVRHRAQQQLIQIGPVVVPHLLPHLKARDIETRRRVLQMMKQLEQERDLAPRRVTATFHNAPLDQVLAALHWQTDIKTKWLGEECKELPRFTGRWDNATYWEAIEQITRQTKTRPGFSEEMLDPNHPTMELVAGLWPSKRPVGFVCSHGRFRLQAIRISVHVERQLIDQDDPDHQPPGMQVTLQVLGEPGVRIAQLDPPRLFSARDDRGRSLVPVPSASSDDEPDEGPAAGQRGVPFRGRNLPDEVGTPIAETELALTRPHPEARRIAQLRGVLPALVVSRLRSQLLAKEIVRGVSFELRGQKQEIRNIWNTAGGKGLQLQIRPVGRRVMRDGDDSEVEIHDLPMLLEFRDEEGRRCPSGITGSLFAGFLVEVQPSAAGKRAKQIYTCEPVVRDMEIPFEFRDIPLP